MPAFYAHYRFGARVSGRLDGEIRKIITKYHAQFAIGLQGPDLFFFYRPWSSNEVSAYGYHLHEISAYPFFEHGVSVVKEKGRDSREYAYLLGFICHFILDSECHPYVAQMIEETGVPHLEIEEEFEKKLLRMDGKDPFAYRLEKLVPTDDDTAAAAAAFYEKADQSTVHQALRDLKMVKRLFTAPGKLEQHAINSVMKLLGKYDNWKGLMNQHQDNEKCLGSNEGLMRRFDRAVPLAVKMMECFDESLQTGSPLDLRFDRTFE